MNRLTFFQLVPLTVILAGCPTSFVPKVELVDSPKKDGGEITVGADTGVPSVNSDSGVSLVPDSGSMTQDAGANDSGQVADDAGVSDSGIPLNDPQRLNLEIIGSSSSFARVTPGNIQCQGTCQLDFEKDTLVTIDLNVAPGAELVQWTGDCPSSGNPCQLLMDSQKDVSAVLTAVRNVVAVNFAGPGNGRIASQPSGLECTSNCSEEFDQGSTITLSAIADPGSTFQGWSGAGCTGTGVCEVDVTGDLQITATFAVQDVSLSVTTTGDGVVESTPAGINCGQDCSENYPFGSSVTLVARPGPQSIFAGWGGACSGTAPCEIELTANTMVTANFDNAPNTLSVNVQGNGRVTSTPAGIDCAAGSTTGCQEAFQPMQRVTLTAAPERGWQIVGWTGDCSGTSATCVVSMSNARTVNVEFGRTEYNVVVERGGAAPNGGEIASMPNGINCGTDCEELFSTNSSVVLTARPLPGFSFDGWYGDCSGTSPNCTITIDGDKAVGARFEAQSRTLVVSRAGTNPNGGRIQTVGSNDIDCGTNCTATFDFGTPVPLRAQAFAGFQFTGWAGACANAGTNIDCVVDMNQDQNVSAEFEVRQTPLTVSVLGNAGNGARVTSNPAGIDCGTDCTENYAFNTVVTLNASFTSNTNFIGWGGACSGTATSCQVTMDQARTVTAEFAPRQFPLVVTLSGNAGAAALVVSSPAGIDCGSDCSENYDVNTIVTLTAVNSPGATFVGWTGTACGANGSSPTCEVRVSQATNVGAEFALPGVDLTVNTVGTGSGRIVSTPAGIDCPGTCTASFPPNSTVNLEPTPDPDSGFSEWSGACGGSNSCSVTMSAPQQVTAEFEDGLVAFYALDGNVVDNSRNGNNGVNSGTTPVGGYDGTSNGAMRFSTGNFIEIASSPELSGFDEMTMCTWIFKILDSSPNTIFVGSKFRFNSGTSADDAYALFINGNDRPRFRAVTNDGGDILDETVSDNRNSSRIWTGAWRHMCGVYNGQQLIIYTDGTVGGRVDQEGTIQQTSEPLILGICASNSLTSCTNLSNPFNGVLDNFKLYNRALSTTEIQAEFNR